MTGLLLLAVAVIVSQLLALLMAAAFCWAAETTSADERTCPLQDWDAAYVRELSDVKP